MQLFLDLTIDEWPAILRLVIWASLVALFPLALAFVKSFWIWCRADTRRLRADLPRGVGSGEIRRTSWISSAVCDRGQVDGDPRGKPNAAAGLRRLA